MHGNKQVPFDGTKARSSDCLDCITSSKMHAVPAPTTPTLTFGVPAALRTKINEKILLYKAKVMI